MHPTNFVDALGFFNGGDSDRDNGIRFELAI